MSASADAGNTSRFSGFADLYDSQRPSPPAALGQLLAAYANVPRPDVVDLGSGTGLSSRWAAGWAASVTGIEPNDDMRGVAASRPADGVVYRAGLGHDTGLATRTADVVIAVQAMHWMEPESTLREVARILRPGGVFAAVDADWPPVSGVAGAEMAWATLHARIRVFEARVARGESIDQVLRPIAPDDPVLRDEDLHDPHKNRLMPEGVRSWAKSQHLDRIRACGHFVFARELLFDEPVPGGADRFVALLRSQGSYQGLLRFGLSDDDLGVTAFEHEVRAAYSHVAAPGPLRFSWRARIGITPLDG